MLCHILIDFIKTKFFHLCLYLTGDNQRPSAINKKTAGLPVKLTINIKKMKMNIS